MDQCQIIYFTLLFQSCVVTCLTKLFIIYPVISLILYIFPNPNNVFTHFSILYTATTTSNEKNKVIFVLLISFCGLPNELVGFSFRRRRPSILLLRLLQLEMEKGEICLLFCSESSSFSFLFSTLFF